MGLPAKLKNFNFFQDGAGFLGEIEEVTIPKLAIKASEWRGGGMLGPIMIDEGLEKLESDWTMGGLIVDALRAFGITTHDGVGARFAGAYKDDGTGIVRACEVSMRGRFQEIDWGNAKVGDSTAHKHKFAVSYLRITIDGSEEVEIDLLAGVFIVGGIDRYADIRAALGA